MGPIGRAHRQFGTTGFLPALISDDLDVLAQAVSAVQADDELNVLNTWIDGRSLQQDADSARKRT